jgi:hypothetical protein
MIKLLSPKTRKSALAISITLALQFIAFLARNHRAQKAFQFGKHKLSQGESKAYNPYGDLLAGAINNQSQYDSKHFAIVILATHQNI